MKLHTFKLTGGVIALKVSIDRNRILYLSSPDKKGKLLVEKLIKTNHGDVSCISELCIDNSDFSAKFLVGILLVSNPSFGDNEYY